MKKTLVIITRYITIFTFLCSSNAGFGQINVGDRAPGIQYNTSFPKDYKLPAKKAILLDFWATWCNPCIQCIKETNDWVPEYNKQIEFICITNHTSKRVDQFIKNGKFNHFFLIDSTNHTFKKFGVESLPTAILIDTNGMIIWRGHGKDITKSILNEFLSTGKVINQTKSLTVSMNDKRTNSFEKTAEDQLKGPSFTIMGSKGDSVNYFFKNKSLNEIIELLYNKQKQVIFKQKSFTTHYDLQVTRKKVNLTTFNLLLLDEISKLVPFSYRIENRDTSIFELIVENEDLLYSKRTQYDSILGKTNDNSVNFENTKEKTQLFSAENITLNELTPILANFYNKPVITNTIIQDRFNFEKIPISDYNKFRNILLKKYGLVLRNTRSKIPFLIIE